MPVRLSGSPMWYGMAEWNSSQNSIMVPKRRYTGSYLSR